MHQYTGKKGKGIKFSEDALNSLKDLLCVFDLNHRLLLWNKKVNELTGYSDSDLSLMHASDLIPGNNCRRFAEMVETVKTKGHASVGLTIIIKDGRELPINFTFTLFRNRENDTIGICGIGRDMGEESRIKKRERYYQQLFNGMLNGFAHCEIISNPAGKPLDARFLDINPAFERITGLKRDRIIGKRASKILPDFRAIWITSYCEVVLSNQPAHSVYHLKEMEKYFATTAYCPEVNQLIAIFTDITDSMKAKEENRMLQSQLFQAQKMEDIGRLTGGIAHDFNNLLTAIHGYTDLALMQKDNEEKLKESLEQINLATERAAQLAQQLLFFSKREPLDLESCNLNDIISNLHKMLARIIGENISVQLKLDPDIRVCRVNQGQIEQIIMNLVVNARDAMRKGGALTIETKNITIEEKNLPFYPYGRSGKFICLLVEDSGKGMDADTIHQIFKPFFTTKKNGQGTGLGLSVVNSIVKEHKGWINVYSEVGVGTTFKIYLPSSHEGATGEDEERVSAEELQGNGETILFVEDERAVCEFMKNQLGENGYSVFPARDAKEAIEICNRKNFNIDLLFTDSVLPDKKGVELIDSLLSHNPELKVILTSGYSYNNNEHPTLNGKSFRFLSKPYTIKSALKMIKLSLESN